MFESIWISERSSSLKEDSSLHGSEAVHDVKGVARTQWPITLAFLLSRSDGCRTAEPRAAAVRAGEGEPVAGVVFKDNSERCKIACANAHTNSTDDRAALLPRVGAKTRLRFGLNDDTKAINSLADYLQLMEFGRQTIEPGEYRLSLR
jgi:hypothetical protein